MTIHEQSLRDLQTGLLPFKALTSVKPRASGTRREPHHSQVFTPDLLAERLASWADVSGLASVRAIDLGAGTGALSEALVGRLHEFSGSLDIHMVEADALLVDSLIRDAPAWNSGWNTSYSVSHANLLDVASDLVAGQKFTHVLLNPPYARVAAGSEDRLKLRALGMHVSNLYAAFLWIGADLLANDGEMLAIVPRSFCNGPSYRALRRHLLSRLSITRIHHFTDRKSVFGRDQVQQEILLLKFTKTRLVPPSDVLVTVSRSVEDMIDLPMSFRPEDVFLHASAQDTLIRIPSHSAGDTRLRNGVPLVGSLEYVSTGSVVDFRTPQLHLTAENASVPLYDIWDVRGERPNKKPRRFLRRTPETEKHILEPANYVIVARFSPREQKPRLRVRVVRAAEVEAYGGVAFENHVNVVAGLEVGLSDARAAQLERLLRSEVVDLQFRELSGTTQVNATDVRLLRVGAPGCAEELSVSLGCDLTIPSEEEK